MPYFSELLIFLWMSHFLFLFLSHCLLSASYPFEACDIPFTPPILCFPPVPNLVSDNFPHHILSLVSYLHICNACLRASCLVFSVNKYCITLSIISSSPQSKTSMLHNRFLIQYAMSFLCCCLSCIKPTCSASLISHLRVFFSS